MGWLGLTHLLVLSIVSALTKGCCQDIQRKRISEEKPRPRTHYRLVRGDPFVMPCLDPLSPLSEDGVVWSKSRGVVEQPTPLPSVSQTRRALETWLSRGNLLETPAVSADLSGNYSCRTSSGEGLDLQLQVLEDPRMGCSELGSSQVTLTQGLGGEIYCPGSSCQDPELSSTQVTWYKDGRPIAGLQQKRDVCWQGVRLELCSVFQTDAGVYSCDRHRGAPGPLWVTRRALTVNVIPPDTRNSPMILVPYSNRSEIVDIGGPHTLLCKVKFGFQRNFTPVVRWYSSSAADQTQMVLIGQQEELKEREQLSSTHETLVTQVAFLPEVTELHLQQIFTCLASNAVGTTNSSTRLRRRETGGWLAGAVCPVVCVVLLTGLAVTLHRHHLELTLLYRTYWKSSLQAGGDRKDVDVFLSCVRSPALENGTGSHTTPPPTGSGQPGTSSSSSSIPSIVGKKASPPGREPMAYTWLEVQLLSILEGLGYRLFLMERDLLPGGVYTEDVVRVLQRSRCLVCLLSNDFLSNSSCVFVLEAGIQALLRDPELQVMVIWTEPGPLSLAQLVPPLPTLVHRALRVLPVLYWPPDLPPETSRMLWKSFWKAMPKQSGPHTQPLNPF